MRNAAISALAVVLFPILLAAQTVYPQPEAQQMPCTTSAPCPPPAASQPDTKAPPPTPDAPPSAPLPETPAASTPDPSSTSVEKRPVQPALGPGVVAAGTAISATLDTQLSMRTSRPGDHFTATVSKPVTGADGETLIPAGARITGQVAQAEQGKVLPPVRGRGRLSLRFTSVELPNKGQVQMAATLVSMHQPKTAMTNEKNHDAVGQGVGVSGGNVLGQGSEDVDLPAKTEVKLRLDQNLALPK